MQRITVLLAEDHRVVRQGFRKLLDSEGDISVVGEAQTGREAVQMVKRLRPAVVVMDIGMPLLNGLEATRQILKAVPTTRVLMLSAHGDDAYIEQALELGALGFLLKQTSSDDLSRAIREVHNGRAYFSPSVAKRFRHRDQRSPNGTKGSRKKITRLTSREMEVLQLIAEGKANKETAGELGISIKTIEKHRQTLMEKLGIHDTASLTRYAISAGIIENSVQLIIV